MTDKEQIQIAPSPPAPTAQRGSTTVLRPEDYNPELAKATMAKEFFHELAPFMVVSKKFVVYHGLFKALNHTEQNRTGFDCSLRLAAYDNIGRRTPNIDGKSFDAAITYLSSAMVNINQIPQQTQNQFNNEPGFFRRVLNRVTGQGGEQQNAKPQS